MNEIQLTKWSNIKRRLAEIVYSKKTPCKFCKGDRHAELRLLSDFTNDSIIMVCHACFTHQQITVDLEDEFQKLKENK